MGTDKVRGAPWGMGNHVAGLVSPSLARRGAQIAILAASYYLAARVGLRFSLVGQSVTPLWPASGIAVAGLFLLGPRVWPGVAIAALAANLPISPSVLAALAIAAGNTVGPLLGATLLRRVGFRTRMDRVLDVTVVIVVGGLLGTLVSASIGAETLVASGVIPAMHFWSAWWVWWTGDAMGVMVVAPFLFSLLHLRDVPPLSWGRRLEVAALLVGVTAVTYGAVYTGLQLSFLVLPILGWAAWRHQQRAAAPAALLVSGVATWGAAHTSKLFASGNLVERMLTLQIFNATVVFTAFAFGALVIERMRDREALERFATGLEDRVRRRTAELSLSNSHLVREVADREEAQQRLRQRERQLAEAQHIARIGSWLWVVSDGRVTWSEEMYRIHGREPGDAPLTFEDAVEAIVPGDLDTVRANVTEALAKRKDHVLPTIEYRIRRPDGIERELRGRARLTFDPNGEPLRMVGTVQDITEENRAEREHRIAEALQRSLLPASLPTIPGVAMAARYVAATMEMEIGGDWYDVVQLPHGRVGVAIGDVAGHGLAATSTMGQLRMGLRAYALDNPSPAEVVRRLHLLAQTMQVAELATLLYLVLDPGSESISFASAGHIPPLVIRSGGEAEYIDGRHGPPIGAAEHAEQYEEDEVRLEPGSTLVLFTDGLIERRGSSLREGLDRLREAATGAAPDVDALCTRLVSSMLGEDVSDDVALLAIRPVSFDGSPLEVRFPADPRALASLRHAMRRWLGQMQISTEDAEEVLVACGEACANAIVHAYGGGEGEIRLELALFGDEVELTVADTGRWRERNTTEGGRGIPLMKGFMDSVEFERGPTGTSVRMRRKLRDRVRS